MNIFIQSKKIKITSKNYTVIREAIYNNKVMIKDYKPEIKKELVKIIDKIPLFDVYKNDFIFVSYDELYNSFFNKALRLKEHPLFDFQELSKKFINELFYKSSELFGNITNCVKSSFIPFFKHIKPYFTKEELIYSALNSSLIKEIDESKIDLVKICDLVTKNSILAKDILAHHNYIMKEGKQNLIKNYTFYDSYFFNNCLRNDNIFDEIIYKNIVLLDKLIHNAPVFSNDIIVYRFITDDSYLKNLKVNDIYVNNSFISCSRNAFYDPKDNIFGEIVLKIHIPKKKKGFALSVEGYSMYPHEEEIILPPFLEMKIISIDDNYSYFHFNKNAEIKKKYEIKIIGKKKIDLKTKKVNSCPIYPLEELYFSMDSFEKQIEHLYDNLCHNNYLFKIKTNEILLFTVIKYDSKNPHYSKFYKIQTSEGIVINYVHESTFDVIYTFELTKDCIYANYISKYYPCRYSFDENHFARILAIVGKIFRIEDAIVYPIYMPCEGNSLELDLISYNYDLKQNKKPFESFDTVYNNWGKNKNYQKIVKENPEKLEDKIDDDLFYQLNINDILNKLGMKMFTNNSYYVKDKYIRKFGIKK